MPHRSSPPRRPRTPEVLCVRRTRSRICRPTARARHCTLDRHWARRSGYIADPVAVALTRVPIVGFAAVLQRGDIAYLAELFVAKVPAVGAAVWLSNELLARQGFTDDASREYVHGSAHFRAVLKAVA